MTNKIKLIFFLIILPAALLISSCGEGTYNGLTVSEIKSVEDYVMSSYFLLRGDSSLAESRAAWPAHTIALTFPAAGSTTTKTKQNYPENGQRTEVTITPHASLPNIYFVENVTTYPNREEIIAHTTESYYVKDMDANGTFDNADYLWDITPAVDAADFNIRSKFESLYLDGSIRYESVEATTTNDSVQYAAFDVDGSLSFPDGTTYAPTTDSNANYSSMVCYLQEEKSSISAWPANKIIVGTRYYTEHGLPDNPTKTAVAYERIYSRETAPTDLDTQVAALNNNLFSDTLGTLLAETVIRYEILPNNQKTVRTNTTIFDSNNGANIVTFTAHFEEDENGVIIYSGEPVAVY